MSSFFNILKDTSFHEQIPVFIGVSYDYGFYLEKVKKPANFYQHPLLFVLIPGNGVIIDHSLREAFQIIPRNWKLNEFPEPVIQKQESVLEMEYNVTYEEYTNKIKEILQLIRAGEVYQINYTFRISTSLPSSPYSVFRKFYEINPAPFSFYLNLGKFQLISNSPERFIRYRNGFIETEPIKGTIQRGLTKEEDERFRQQLIASEKDKAELSMIVDLLRNDLNRICDTGSVQVENHARVESFENVHHLVSTIRGKMSEFDFLQMLHAVFPGGSITGCPKIAAMNYISQLEKQNRSFYTGSFFIYFPKREEIDSSILIRTAMAERAQIHFHVGGGIVIDSNPDAEYQECLAKAGSFMKTIKQKL
jgi:para-aminobenzoate synthetase component 1